MASVISSLIEKNDFKKDLTSFSNRHDAEASGQRHHIKQIATQIVRLN
jgi:hypothetical protein